jgi:hypothetical protein
MLQCEGIEKAPGASGSGDELGTLENAFHPQYIKRLTTCQLPQFLISYVTDLVAKHLRGLRRLAGAVVQASRGQQDRRLLTWRGARWQQAAMTS